MRPLLLALTLSLLTTPAAFAAATAVAVPNPTTAPAPGLSPELKARMEQALAKYEALRILTREDPTFRSRWESALRIATVVKPKLAGTEDFVASVAGNLAFELADPYLARTDDAGANAFGAMLAKLMQLGTRDEIMCKAVTSSTSGATLTDAEEAALEEAAGPSFTRDMMAAFLGVLRTGRDGPLQLPEKLPLQDSLLKFVTAMIEKHGPESLALMDKLSDPSIPAMRRCEAMGWMMEAIMALPEHERAGVIRTMFSAEGRKMMQAAE
ncbi:hypothetical protein [Arenimonas oryziterrae]|nr:hypothetical protein [Arenimonas oryziterrae]